jgi:apolipoprotein N-acyltransferase
VALCGALVTALVVERGTYRVVAGAGIAVLVLVGIGLPLPGPTSGGPVVSVAVVQGNVPGSGVDALGEARTVTRNHLAATEELAEQIESGQVQPVDLVIWPENSTDIDPFRDADTREVIEQAVDAVGVPILVGAILDGPGEDHRRTAGVLWAPDSGPDLDQVYVKRHPVPFGEYIPFRDQLLPLIGRLEQVGRDTFAGDQPGRIVADDLTLGDVICFEIAYDDIVRDVVDSGAEVLVVQTNNATFSGSAQPAQQFDISRLRAIETGRSVVIASTNGISAVIRPDGSVVDQTAVGTQEVLTASVERTTDRTMASRLGSWPEWTLAALGLIGLGAALVRRRQDNADG